MSGWIDRWARATAARPPRLPAAPPPEAPGGLTRRDLVKRAGIVVGAAWTLPLVQSAVAPAFAASGGCSPTCGIGYPCSTNGDCASGNCAGGFCAEPGKNWAGATCTSDSQCMSEKCSGGRCVAGSKGSPCASMADCTNPLGCASNKVCGGPGAACTGNGHCVSNRCRGGVCS